MPSNKHDTDDRPSIARSRQVRVDLAVEQTDYDRFLDLAAKADMANAAAIYTALSIGLNVLEGPGGLELLEGVAMLRFLRGKPTG